MRVLLAQHMRVDNNGSPTPGTINLRACWQMPVPGLLGCVCPGKRILLVEDDPDVAEILTVVLRSESYDVDVAGTVTDAHGAT